jgi:hypothetical protein
MTCYTTTYSRRFYEKLGHYARVGGLEIARVGDDEAGGAQAQGRLGQGLRHPGADDHAEGGGGKFPLLEEDLIQGALWDPDAGLVMPRSQIVAGELIERPWPAASCVPSPTRRRGLDVRERPGQAACTPPGAISSAPGVVCAGIWGRLIAGHGGRGPAGHAGGASADLLRALREFAGTGKEIGYPLLRDQGNSAYLRDTGDPKATEGGQIEWGYYEEKSRAWCIRAILLEKEQPGSRPPARPGDGPGHRALRAGHGAHPHPRRARLGREALLQRPALRSPPTAAPSIGESPESAACGTARRSGSRTARAPASCSPTG